MFSKIRQLAMEHFTVCPKTGKITGIEKLKRKSLWLWIIIGLASVIWFFIRVVPKPDRAEYPCQKVAKPIAAGFIAWLIGLAASTLIVKKARHLFKRKRYVVGVVFFAIGIMLCFFTFNDMRDATAAPTAFEPTDSPNSPIGTAKGINPGRVVWVYDKELCNTSIFNWWENSDVEVAKRMMTQAIFNLTGKADMTEAWDTLFKNFNETHNDEINTGYQVGDKIAIKINNNFSRTYAWAGNTLRPNPQMVYALTYHLVNYAGIPEEDITYYDCIWYHGDPVYNLCHTDFPGVRWAEGDCTDRNNFEGGPNNDISNPFGNSGTREQIVDDPNCVIYYGDTNLVKGSGKVRLPTVVSEAKYGMSFSLPRAHSDLAGVTCCAKNFFGSVWHPTIYDYYHHWQPMFMHEAVAAHALGSIPMQAMGSYNALVDIMGHKDLGGKCVLLLAEIIPLYRDNKWSGAPFNGGHPQSIFVSQDFVAIESVLLDFLRTTDAGLKDGTIDNYLHEAAQADDPPSGTVYDPENDGIPLGSLGVHEHWNNATDRDYSRNLGTGDGIELIHVIDNVTDLDTSHQVVVDPRIIQNNFTLAENYPNPFDALTTISYSLKASAGVRLDIYNIKGELIHTLVNQHQSAGTYETTWNGCNENNIRVASGLYIYRMEINTGKEINSQARQMLLK